MLYTLLIFFFEPFKKITDHNSHKLQIARELNLCGEPAGLICIWCSCWVKQCLVCWSGNLIRLEILTGDQGAWINIPLWTQKPLKPNLARILSIRTKTQSRCTYYGQSFHILLYRCILILSTTIFFHWQSDAQNPPPHPITYPYGISGLQDTFLGTQSTRTL